MPQALAFYRDLLGFGAVPTLMPHTNSSQIGTQGGAAKNGSISTQARVRPKASTTASAGRSCTRQNTVNVNYGLPVQFLDFSIKELGRLGLEPRTKALKGPCSTN